MKFGFGKPVTSVTADICEYVAENSLPISVEVLHNLIKLSVSKWGTSTFSFEAESSIDGSSCVLTLANQKIAWAHKSYISEFKDQLSAAMESIGGKLL